MTRRSTFLILPIHSRYHKNHAMVKCLEPMLGDIGYVAWTVLENLDELRGFKQDCERGLEMMIDGLSNSDGLADYTARQWQIFWKCPATEVFLDMFFEEQNQLFHQYLGNDIKDYYYNFTDMRPGVIVVESWKKDLYG